MSKKQKIKMTVDVLMSVVLLFVMAYQVTGNLYHEVLGTAMLVLFVIHNILNRKWYGGLFQGKYTPVRVLWTIINIAVLVSILITGYSGIAISRNLFAFLNLSTGTVSARTLHLAGSYWSFVLMSLHVGVHWSMVVRSIGKSVKAPVILRWILRIAAFVLAGYGAVRFYKADIYSYMFLKNAFAFLDYEKPAIRILFEHIAMMSCFVYISYYLIKGIGDLNGANKTKKRTQALAGICAAALIFCLTFTNVFSQTKDNDFDLNSWGATSSSAVRDTGPS